MRFAIMGAGGVGAFFGAKLLKAGFDVTFVARGDHLKALQTQGLVVRDNDQETRFPEVRAIGETAGAEPVDVILFTVKLPDTETAARACLPLMHDDSVVLTVQNGLDAPDMVAGVVGAGRVLGGATYIVAKIEAPGIIAKSGPAERIEFAEPGGGASERGRRLEEALTSAGIDAHMKDDLSRLLWRKFLLLSATSSMTALTRQPVGYLQADPVAGEVLKMAVDEAVAVALAAHVDLPADAADKTFHTLFNVMNAEAKSSQLVDLERGKPLELEWLSGKIHHLGKEFGVPTPVHSTVYAALRPFAAGAPHD